MTSNAALWCVGMSILLVCYSEACDCSVKPTDPINTSQSLLLFKNNTYTEPNLAKVNSFPNIHPGSIKDRKLSRWYVLDRKTKKEKIIKLSKVRQIFKRAQKKLIPHTYKHLIRNDKIASKTKNVRNRRHVFSAVDSRAKVLNIREAPYSAIVFIKDRGCSGFFVGPRHVLTAAHCVYNVTSNSWHTDLNFYRGKNCNPDKGYSYRWKKAIIPSGYKDHKHPAYDYAMLISFEKSPNVMNFGWTNRPTSLTSVHIAGYPSDKPEMCMWESECSIEDEWSSLLGHRCDTTGGNSGSAVYTHSGSFATVYCIHRGYVGLSVNSNGENRDMAKGSQQHTNVCSLITKQRLLMFSEWIAKH